ncbi:bacterio-opsin activator domain-containing protein [Halogeometricum limi]|uniref:Predicted DNA binding protein, contains HTH domain n=1 Tax=Halogeometricum limi TaxID=555875 RepID=A0A1I6HM47_9EURY|nr:bacterio-opsin activator domain-containing protein [Halogeometricum limi]SFR55360.1 Predicted DNA binding protein, contains HTH domain [Halogeometricum limi]
MESIDTQRYLRAFGEGGTDGEPLTAAEVATMVGDEDDRAVGVLGELEDEGRVRAKRVGEERVWWVDAATRRPAVARSLPTPGVAVDSLLRVMPVGALLLDADGDVLRANDRARELLDLDDGDESLSRSDWLTGTETSVVDRVVASRETLTREEVVSDDASDRLVVSAAPIVQHDSVEQVVVTFDRVSADEQTVDGVSERLARLVSTFRATVAVVVEATNKAQLESRLCHRLVDDGPYAFAWVGRVNWVTETVSPTHWATRSDTDLPERPASKRAISVGPAATVVAERRTVLVADLELADPSVDEEWRTESLERGYRSMAAIPLNYEGRLFGVLSVYSREPGVFGGGSSHDVAIRDEDADILTDLGRAVGHALSALERRDALLTESVVEVRYRSRAMGERFAGLPDGVCIVVDQTVPMEDSQIQFYTVEGTDADTFASAMEGRSDVETTRVIESDGDSGRVAVQTTHRSLAHVMATHGGKVDEMRIEGGVVSFTAVLPQFVDVQEVTRVVRDEFGGVELVDYRTTVPERRRDADVAAGLEAQLTDRQWSALELAYYGGYFDWPTRGGSLEDIATEIGVTPQTASEHLRKAESKVFSMLFETVLSDGGAEPV